MKQAKPIPSGENLPAHFLTFRQEPAKIVHVLSDAAIGCAAFELANCLTALGNSFDCTVILPKGSPSAKILPRAKTVFAPISSGKSFSPKDCVTLRSLLADIRPAVLHTHASLSARVAGRSLHVPNILSTRHLVSGSRFMRSFLAPSLYRMTTDVTVSTSASATYSLLLDGTDAASLVTLPSGVPQLPKLTPSEEAALRAELSIPPDAKIIGCSVFPGAEGGEELLLHSFANLTENVNHYLLFVGKSDIFVNLSLLSASLGISRNVRFYRQSDDARACVQCAARSLFDVEVFPADRVGLSPILIPEAMSIATPIVASSASRHTDFVTHGVSGFLFRKGDVYGLTDLLSRFLHSPEEFRQIGNAGKRLWEKQYSLPVMALRYRRLYDYLLSTDASSRSPLALRYLFL